MAFSSSFSSVAPLASFSYKPPPPRKELKKTRLESGDQTGRQSTAGSKVNRVLRVSGDVMQPQVSVALCVVASRGDPRSIGGKGHVYSNHPLLPKWTTTGRRGPAIPDGSGRRSPIDRPRPHCSKRSTPHARVARSVWQCSLRAAPLPLTGRLLPMSKLCATRVASSRRNSKMTVRIERHGPLLGPDAGAGSIVPVRPGSPPRHCFEPCRRPSSSSKENAGRPAGTTASDGSALRPPER